MNHRPGGSCLHLYPKKCPHTAPSLWSGLILVEAFGLRQVPIAFLAALFDEELELGSVTKKNMQDS